MYNQSLEQFYKKINKRIMLVSSYLGDSSYDFIIRACRLKPLNAMFGSKFNSQITTLENEWVDEFGNILDISDKKPRVIFNNITLDRAALLSTDPYYSRRVCDLAANSKLAFILVGEDEDYLDEYYIVSLLGNDGYLRTYVYIYGKWEQYSSLCLGLKTLGAIAGSRDVKHFINVKNKVSTVYPCGEWEAWITSWPASQAFKQILEDFPNLNVTLTGANK